ncbi:MAG: hypothetical protein ACLTEE_01925 [Anaerobutyricum hallii]
MPELLKELDSDAHSVKACIIHCSCGKTAFSSSFEKTGEHTLRCRNCGSTIYTMGVKDYELPLNLGAKLYKCLTTKNSDDFESVTGMVIENRLKKGLFGIKNMSMMSGRQVSG